MHKNQKVTFRQNRVERGANDEEMYKEGPAPTRLDLCSLAKKKPTGLVT